MTEDTYPGFPQHVGPFRVTTTQGASTHTRTYRATDDAGLAVLVTVLRGHAAEEPAVRARMRADVDALRRAGNTFSAPLAQADPDAPTPWIAFRADHDKTLVAHVSEHGPLPADRVWQLAVALVGAVSAAGAAGVAYRALGPENLVLTLEGLRLTGLGTPGGVSLVPSLPRDDAVTAGEVLLFAATGRFPADGISPDLPEGLRPLLARCLTRTTTLDDVAAEARARLRG